MRYGTALMACAAVDASTLRFHPCFQVDEYLRFAEDPDRPIALRPLWCRLFMDPPDCLLADDGDVVDHRVPAEALTGDRPGGDSSGSGVEIDVG